MSHTTDTTEFPVSGRAIREWDRIFAAVGPALMGFLHLSLHDDELAAEAWRTVRLRCEQQSPKDHKPVRTRIFAAALRVIEELSEGAEDQPGDAFSPAVETVRHDVHTLREIIRATPAEPRRVFLLKQNGNFTFAEIAELLETTPESVEQQMRDALAHLQSRLTPAF